MVAMRRENPRKKDRRKDIRARECDVVEAQDHPGGVRTATKHWIPASAGMTGRRFLSASVAVELIRCNYKALRTRSR